MKNKFEQISNSQDIPLRFPTRNKAQLNQIGGWVEVGRYIPLCLISFVHPLRSSWTSSGATEVRNHASAYLTSSGFAAAAASASAFLIAAALSLLKTLFRKAGIGEGVE